MNGHIEFKPPSDFQSEDSGGGGNKQIWTWLGIGCGAILLVVAGFLAYGAYETASCCGQVVDAGKYTMSAQQTSQEFARKLGQGKFTEAWDMTTDDLRSRMSVDELKEKLAEHGDLLRNSSARMGQINVQSKGGQQDAMKPEAWDTSFHFSPPSADEKLVMNLVVVREGEGDAARFFIDDVRLNRRKRVLRSEPPARAVLEFHRNLQQGAYQQAYQTMSMSYQQNNTQADFESMVDENVEALVEGRPKVTAVDYSGNQAMVTVSVEKSHRINYTLSKQIGWSIDEMKVTTVDGPAVDQKAEEKVGETQKADAGSGEKAGQDAGTKEKDEPDKKEDEK